MKKILKALKLPATKADLRAFIKKRERELSGTAVLIATVLMVIIIQSGGDKNNTAQQDTSHLPKLEPAETAVVNKKKAEDYAATTSDQLESTVPNDQLIQLAVAGKEREAVTEQGGSTLVEDLGEREIEVTSGTEAEKVWREDRQERGSVRTIKKSSPKSAIAEMVEKIRGTGGSDATSSTDHGDSDIRELLAKLTEGQIESNKAIAELQKKVSNGHEARPATQEDTAFKGLHLVRGKRSGKIETGVVASVGGRFVSCVIAEDMVVKNGDRLPLRAKDAFELNGRHIKANTIINTITSFGKNRVMLHAYNVVYKDEVIPLSATFIDKDGIPGLYSPNTDNADLVKEEMSKNIQDIDNSGMVVSNNSSLPGELALKGSNVLIGAAKIIAIKKLSTQTVQVMAGYPIIMQLN